MSQQNMLFFSKEKLLSSFYLKEGAWGRLGDHHAGDEQGGAGGEDQDQAPGEQAGCRADEGRSCF